MQCICWNDLPRWAYAVITVNFFDGWQMLNVWVQYSLKVLLWLMWCLGMSRVSVLLPKDSKVYGHLRRLRADIALLQETHLGESDFQRLKRLWVGQVIGSPSKEKKAGVIILIQWNFQGTLGQVDQDTEGRMIMRIKLSAPTWAVTNVYAPNVQTKATYQALSKWLLSPDQSLHIVEGDFNKELRQVSWWEDCAASPINKYASLALKRHQARWRHPLRLLNSITKRKNVHTKMIGRSCDGQLKW